MGPSKMIFLSIRVVFHFHDYGTTWPGDGTTWPGDIFHWPFVSGEAVSETHRFDEMPSATMKGICLES